MSDNFKYTAGLNNVGSYQVSGKPFVTASTISDGVEQQIEFPQVTNNVTVKLDSDGGIEYNSIEISGNFDFKSQHKPFQAEGNTGNYSVSLWVSSSGTALSDNATLWTFGGNSRNMIREKSGNWQFIVISEDGQVPTAAIRSVPVGWHFLVAVASGSNPDGPGTLFQTLYLNGGSANIKSISSPTNCSPDIDFGDGHFFIGPITSGNSNFADTIKFRDLIVWSDALTSAQVITIYNGGGYYDASQFTDIAKKVWIKDNFDIHDNPENHSGSAGTFSVQHYNVNDGDVKQISTDAPFADVPGSGGELRVHFRSTGSSNVATNKHYWTLDSQNESITMNVKSKEIYLSSDGGDCDYSLQADLTSIPSSRMYQHTGSGVDE